MQKSLIEPKLNQIHRKSVHIEEEIKSIKNKSNFQDIDNLNKDKDVKNGKSIRMPDEFKDFHKIHKHRVLNSVKCVKPLESEHFLNLTEYQFVDQFNNQDIFGVGQLTEESMIKMGNDLGIPKKLMLRMVGEIDSDGNGEITLEEWLHYMKLTQKQAASSSGSMNAFCDFIANQAQNSLAHKQFDLNSSKRLNLNDDESLNLHQLTGALKIAQNIKSKSNNEEPNSYEIKVKTQQTFFSDSSQSDSEEDVFKLNEQSKKITRLRSNSFNQIPSFNAKKRRDSNSSIQQDQTDLEKFFEENKAKDSKKKVDVQNHIDTTNNLTLKTNSLNKKSFSKQKTFDISTFNPVQQIETDCNSNFDNVNSISSIVNKNTKIEISPRSPPKRKVGLFAAIGSTILKGKDIVN